jgi:hypothetical protein
MTPRDIQNTPEVKRAALVLAKLEQGGLVEPAIASGWTRSLLTNTTSPDIDVSYVGPVHYKQAQPILGEALRNIDPENAAIWDVGGIWNAQMAYGVTRTVDNFLLYYVDSIDSVYLASDGLLHDPTGHGFADAATRTLRVNMYDVEQGILTDRENVNVCLESCRRMARLGWTPTPESTDRIVDGLGSWQKIGVDDRLYYTKKLAKKYGRSDVAAARPVYERYGWGFVFDEPDFLARVR